MTLALSDTFQTLLELQSGVISRQQAMESGLPPAAIDSQVRSGRWQRLHSGVYATFTGRPDRQAQLWAAVLRAGPAAALSYWTAAELFGLTSEPRELIHVTVPHGARPISGVMVHRSGSVTDARHPMLLPPRTRIEHTVIDLTQVAGSFDQAFNWLSRAVGRRLTTQARLSAALAARQRARWRAELLMALGDVTEGIMSPLERRYVYGVERAHGLPPARRQVKIVTDGRTRYLDNLYEDAQLAVELDGRATHPPEQRWSDSHRDNAHASIGLLTLRYNWQDCTELACASAAQVAALLRMRGVAVSPRRCSQDCSVMANQQVP
jgi:hypothetical protein